MLNRPLVVLLSLVYCLSLTACNVSSPSTTELTTMTDSHPAESAASTEQPQVDETQPLAGRQLAEATFGGGCFWCVEAVFLQLQGVEKVESGYSGGTVENPTYDLVCSGLTGHAEVCQITYDPAQVSYDELLEVFWKTHDPTTLNRQGADTGTQYRSIIFYHNAQQKALAEKYKRELDASGAWDHPIVTEIAPFLKFYKAEDYHQNYFVSNPNQGYCRAIIKPKVDKFRKVFKDKLKADATVDD